MMKDKRTLMRKPQVSLFKRWLLITVYIDKNARIKIMIRDIIWFFNLNICNDNCVVSLSSGSSLLFISFQVFIVRCL
jgi:hypothetical protein